MGRQDAAEAQAGEARPVLVLPQLLGVLRRKSIRDVISEAHQ